MKRLTEAEKAKLTDVHNRHGWYGAQYLKKDNYGHTDWYDYTVIGKTQEKIQDLYLEAARLIELANECQEAIKSIVDWMSTCCVSGKKHDKLLENRCDWCGDYASFANCDLFIDPDNEEVLLCANCQEATEIDNLKLVKLF